MSLTKITNRVIEPGTITANSIAEGISLGGGGGVTIDQIIVTDSNFANTANTEIPASGGYLKVYGSGFEANANVYLTTAFALDTQVTANVVSSNEIRLTIGSTIASTYNLFLININASIATKVNALIIYADQENAGWFAGGYTPPTRSTVERILFDSDTVTATVRGPLGAARYRLAASSNFNYGWVGGGNGPSSRVDRITFASDMNTASLRGPLSAGKYSLAATGNDNYGWFTGGSPAPNEVVYRINYADDTSTTSVRGGLNQGRIQHAAVGNDNFGWHVGGNQAPQNVTVDRINYASDTIAASNRGSLRTGTFLLAAVGNQEYGWISNETTAMDRITFSNDTVLATARGRLNFLRTSLAAADNNNYGWFAGGGPGAPGKTTVDRINFSDDTTTATLRGQLTIGRYLLTGASGVA